MAGSEPKQQAKGQGFALFDRHGRLIEWDDRFGSKPAQSDAHLKSGMTLRAFIDKAFAGDAAARTDYAARSQFDPDKPWDDAEMIAATESQVFDIRTDHGGIVRIQQLPTRSGGMMFTAQDVTAERRSSAFFAHADENWCLDGSPTLEAIISIVVKADGSLDIGPAPEELRAVWGLSAEHDLNDTAANLSRMLATAEDRAQNQAMMAEVCATLAPNWHLTRVRGSDERLRWIRVSITAERGRNGETLVTQRHRDVTRQMVADDQLQLLRSAVTHATDAIQIIHTDPQGRSTTVYANPAFERATGWRTEEVIGQSVREMDGWNAAYWERLVVKAAQGDEAAIEVQVPHRDRGPVWLEVTAKVIDRRPDGGFRWVAVARNIDERRRVQEDLFRAMDEAQAANRAKSEFLANMSHEIRTPMNGVIGMNGLLLRSALTPDQRKYAEAVKASADSLLGIINDILDVSKLEAGRVELESIDFSLAKVVEDAVELMSTKAREKRLDLTCTLDEGARTPLCGDPTRLRQIVLNLLSNALKFTEQGFIALDVRSQTLADGRTSLRLEVSDSGIGLSPEAKAKLFNKFQQADGSIARRFGGTGLGLSICRQLVELMDGRIGVDDRPGGGAVFWVEIALKGSKSSVREQADAGPLEAVETPPSPAPPGRVLVAEDNEINTFLARTLLEAAGYAVDCVSNGREAVEAATSAAFDLILMDVQMPEMDGLEATRQIRRAGGRAARTPIVAITANAMQSDRDRCADAGMDGYVSKPFEPEAFLETVAAFIREPEPADLRTVQG